MLAPSPSWLALRSLIGDGRPPSPTRDTRHATRHAHALAPDSSSRGSSRSLQRPPPNRRTTFVLQGLRAVAAHQTAPCAPPLSSDAARRIAAAAPGPSALRSCPAACARPCAARGACEQTAERKIPPPEKLRLTEFRCKRERACHERLCHPCAGRRAGGPGEEQEQPRGAGSARDPGGARSAAQVRACVCARVLCSAGIRGGGGSRCGVGRSGAGARGS
jgi:hypothetical protein